MRQLIPALRSSLWDEKRELDYYECRQCGRTADQETEECPACGGEIAKYQI